MENEKSKTETEKTPAENGDEEKNEAQTDRRRLGGIRTMPFILVNEACDRFAGTGFHANIITYLTKELNLPLVKASNILTNFGGTSNITPLIGALIADSFAGRFSTIIFASIIYELGMVSITISAVLPQLHPPPCPTHEQNCKEATSAHLLFLYISLLLISLGTGGIRPCVVAFAADQFDGTKSRILHAGTWNFFNLYFFCMGLATLTALTVVVYVQDNVGWGWGLGIPTIAMALSVVVFVIGAPLYRKVKPGGSPLIRLCQVIVSAVKKRNVEVPADSCLLYQNKELDDVITTHGKLIHTHQFRCLDRAAVVTDDDDRRIEDHESKQKHPNLWRINTVHRVEELKSIIRVLPIWGAGILFVTSEAHLGSFTIQQARTMDRHLSHSFEIPPASLSIFSNITVLTSLVMYDRLLVPLARRFTENAAGITCLQRIGTGLAISILSTIVSAVVEIKRKKALDKPAADVNIPYTISVFWLTPQYCLHGLAKAFMSVGHLEFLYDQSPESMRSIAVALYCIALSIGNYVGTFLISVVHKCTGKEKNWLPDRNLNKGRLENYYWLLTGIQGVNLVYYLVCAWYYKFKPLDEDESKEGRDDENVDSEFWKEV